MDYYVAEGKIESVTYVDDKKELKNIEPVLSGDDLTIPSTLVWHDTAFMCNQVILTKKMFQQMYKEWILEATDSDNPIMKEVE